MATRIHMEALSPTMEEGQLVRWLKKEGDSIGEGDILAEIETDKATMELVARGVGVLRRIGLAEGETAPVGALIGVIAAEDEDIAALEAELGEVAEKGQAPAGRTEVVGERAAETSSVGPSGGGSAPVEGPVQGAMTRPGAGAGGPAESAAGRPDGRVKASPLARRLASEAGVSLGDVAGSGPGGRITKRDIEVAVAAGGTGRPRLAAHAGPEVEEVPVTQMRKTIAKRLVTSIGPVPTFYLTSEVDMTRVVAARERINARLVEEGGGKASINDFIIKAVAAALARHPEVNASWGGDVIRRHHRVHIGVAVAVADGLITPVVRDADLKAIRDIAAEVRELAGRARERKLKPEEYTGATFSISNLGMFGIDAFTAIINPPEAGILAVGRVEEKVVARAGQVVVEPRMRMTMSCDHRVVDGAMGARFLATVRDFLEEPLMMLA